MVRAKEELVLSDCISSLHRYGKGTVEQEHCDAGAADLTHKSSPTYISIACMICKQHKFHSKVQTKHLKMDGELELPEFNPREPEPVKQQISVPFLWEVKPGAPKRDWVISKPVPVVFACPSPTPTKLLVSVPFQWEEKPGKPIQEASPFHALPDHGGFSASSRSLNPFAVESEEEYSLGFDLEAFGFPDNNDTSGAAAACADGSSGRRDAWFSFSESEDYSQSSGDTSAQEQEFQFPRAPSEKSWEVANDEDQLTNPWSPPRSAVTTLEELMVLSRRLRCGQGLPVDAGKKSISSVELIKKFLIVCS